MRKACLSLDLFLTIRETVMVDFLFGQEWIIVQLLLFHQNLLTLISDINPLDYCLATLQ